MALTTMPLATSTTLIRGGSRARLAQPPRAGPSSMTAGGKKPKAEGKKEKTEGGETYARTLPGVLAPTGYLDPFNLAASVAPAEVKRWREAEVTHGRVAQLAFVGILVGETPSVENNPLFNGAVKGPAVFQFQQVEAQGGFFWEGLVLAIGLAETYRALSGWSKPVGGNSNVLRDDYMPGDIGFDPLGFMPKDEAGKLTMRNKELNNGRLAMFATAGMVAQEKVDGLKIFEHLGILGNQ